MNFEKQTLSCQTVVALAMSLYAIVLFIKVSSYTYSYSIILISIVKHFMFISILVLSCLVSLYGPRWQCYEGSWVIHTPYTLLCKGLYTCISDYYTIPHCTASLYNYSTYSNINRLHININTNKTWPQNFTSLEQRIQNRILLTMKYISFSIHDY